MKRILILLVALAAVVINTTAQDTYWEPINEPYGGDFNITKAVDGTMYAVHKALNWKETYRSLDQGNNWEKLDFLLPAFSNDPNKVVSVGEGGSIFLKITNQFPYQSLYFKTTDDGQSWSQLNSFIQYFSEMPSGVLIGVMSSYSIVRSVDGGINWSVVANASGNITNFGNTPFGGFMFESRQGGVCTLFRSTDEGLTWSNKAISSDYISFFMVPTGTLFALKTDYTLFRSGDGGTTFDSTGFTYAYPPSFMVLPNNRILFLSGGGTLYYSDDDGVTWNTLITYRQGGWGSLVPIPPLADGTIFKIGREALMRSNDGGLTWSTSYNGMKLPDIEAIKFIDDSTFVASTETALWKTTNSGATWSPISRGIFFQGSDKKNFQVTANGHIALFQDSHLFWSEDAGSSFTNISPSASLTATQVYLNPANEHLFAITSTGLERSVNHGQSWNVVIDSILVWNFIMDFHPSGRIFLIQGYNQLVSDDDGITWQAIPLPNNTPFSDIAIAPDGDVYLLGIETQNKVRLWKSEDIGEHWVPLPPELSPVVYETKIFEIAGNGHLYISDGYNIFLSVNEGLTWQTVPNPIGAYPITYSNISCLGISPNQKLFAGTYYSGLSTSINPVSLGANIEGFVSIDADADCSTADSQGPFKNRIVSAQGDNFTYNTNTDPFGRYVFFVDTGSYQVQVTPPNAIWWDICDSTQTLQLSEYFTTDTANFTAVALADCPLMMVNVAVPMLRRCFDNTVFVQYCNQGTQPADSAWVEVSLDPYLSFVSSQQNHIDLGNNTIRFLVGDVASETCGQFQFIVYVNCDSTVLGQTHCITAHGFPDTLCTVVPNWSGANIEASVTCQDTTVHFQLRNTGTAASHALDYIIIEDDVVMLQGVHQYNPGQEFTLPVPANGHTMRIESEQEPGHPFSTLAIAFEEGCGGFESLGFINQFTVNGITPSWHRVCMENTGSFDPNDKQGYPLGAGAEHQIRPGQPIEYMIRFQNTGTDTAFTVAVRDTLSPWLDPASIVPGAASHPYTWQLEGSGVIKFTFSNILLPDSTTNQEASQGFLTFTIDQQPGVPLGTQIFNDAAIFFDFNEPVITNETMHTVGLNLQVGAVEPPNPFRCAVQVAPNPAAAFATFQLVKGRFKAHRLQLFDPLGKPVFETTVSGSQYVLPRNNLTAGAYGWRVTNASGQWVGSGMIVFL